MCAAKTKKDEPILKASTLEATAFPEGNDDTGGPVMQESSSRPSSAPEQPENQLGDGSASGEKHAITGTAGGESESATPLSVKMAWDEAIKQMRESGMLTKLPHFASADWFWGLVLGFNEGVLKDHGNG